MVALFVAVGGTGFSAVTKLLPKNSVGSGQVVDGSLQKVDLSKAAVRKLAGRPGPAGPAGATGPQGPKGEEAVALAYAHVLGGGTIDVSRSENVISLSNTIIPGSNPGIPVFCFDLAVSPKNVVATVENSVVAAPVGIGLIPVDATVDPSVAQGFGCAGGTDAAVVGMRGSGLERLPFYVLFN